VCTERKETMWWVALAVADFLVGGGGSHVLPHASVVLYDHDAQR
jgi:hypothetical protein